MAPNLQINEKNVVKTGEAQLYLSLLLPFEPRVNSRQKIDAGIARLVKKAESELAQQPAEEAAKLMTSLHALIDTIDFSTPKQSIAIIASLQGGKVYYWNMPVQETVLISNELPVRQLAAQRKLEKKYLLMAVGDHFGGIYFGNGPRLEKLVANSPAREVSNSDESPVMRAVRHIDNALSILRRSYRYPVFVIAPGPYLKYFRETSPNAAEAAALVEANPHGDARLQQLMAPHLDNWESLEEKILVQQLEAALDKGKLAVGITEVWAALSEKRGKLLAVEADYKFPAYMDQKNGVLYADTIPMNKDARKLTDAVCAAMEKILADGGQVMVVRNGALSEYLHAAMVCY